MLWELDPPRSHGTSPHWPRVPCPSPSIVHLGWAVPSWEAQQGPMCILGTPAARVTRDTHDRGRSWGWGAHPVPVAVCTGGNGKRKTSSAMATSHSAGGNNRWRRAIYSQKHKGTASWEEAGGWRDREQSRGGLQASQSPREHRLPRCSQGPGRGAGRVPGVQHPPGLMRAAGGIKAGSDFSGSHCFNWVTTNGLL